MTEDQINAKLRALTAGFRSQIDFDTLVSQNGGLGGLRAKEFPGADRDCFSYCWEAAKLATRQTRRMTEND